MNEEKRTLSAKKCTLKGITGNELFVIPYYQRPYAWGAAEVRQLLTDILTSCNSSREKEYCFASDGTGQTPDIG